MKNILFAIIATVLLASCSTTKHITTAQINVDSIATHVRDSMTRVQETIIESYNKSIEELTKVGVTFEDCPVCMNRDSILNLLDSAGRTRYLLIESADRIRDLSRKIEIGADGSLKAEGAIKSALFSKSVSDNELRTMERKYDSLQQANDSLTTSLQMSQKATTKDKTTKPWIPWALLILLAMWYIYREWKAYKFRKIAFVSQPM